MQSILIMKLSHPCKEHTTACHQGNLSNLQLGLILHLHCRLISLHCGPGLDWKANRKRITGVQGMPLVAQAQQNGRMSFHPHSHSLSDAPNHKTGVSGATWWVQITLSPGRNNLCLWTTSDIQPKGSWHKSFSMIWDQNTKLLTAWGITCIWETPYQDSVQ